MRKFLITGLFSAILGIVIGGAPADAALVSRGFLDEALENYATTTALDLKANQSDLTDLSEKTNLPTEITIGKYLWYATGYDPAQMQANIDLPENYTLSDFIQDIYSGRPGGASIFGFEDIAGLIFYGSPLPEKMQNFYGISSYLGLPELTKEVSKIGTLPTEYATVGAALTAIKGIAEDAKAAALAAIPDPKTEGSTGKFVLTVDIVGDNATYRWEKIDREGETTTTTE